ncbi:MAG: hypothetical protein LQ337_002319 [Flavoplaca oasis]|nr:MAG: hypothetical protein LQ337_002319 [Flavoplaca oasis]
METRSQLYFAPSAGRTSEDDQHYLIFHIPGNPGLITYYDPFLSTLHALLSSSPTSPSANFHICGHSLAGFETTEQPHNLAGLQRQIEYIDDLLYEEVDEVRRQSRQTPKVLLMGHSVGAYILLEIIQRHRRRIEGGAPDFDLIGGILLFPTITHIARSPSGMVASALLAIPRAAHIASAIVKSLTYLIPASILYHLIRVFAWFPEHAARTTAAFIKSPIGVKESLILGKDEMDMITNDKWGEEIWGAATEPGTNSKDTIHSNLVFFWGSNDKWVAQKTRNELIDARGYRRSKASSSTTSSLSDVSSPVDGWKPSMFIDDKKIPHGFCIKHSEVVAEQVRTWVEEIILNHNES